MFHNTAPIGMIFRITTLTHKYAHIKINKLKKKTKNENKIT